MCHYRQVKVYFIYFLICFIKNYFWILAIYFLMISHFTARLVLSFYRFKDDRKDYFMHEWFSKTIIFSEKTCCNKILMELSSYHVNCFEKKPLKKPIVSWHTHSLSSFLKIISHSCWSPIFISYVVNLQTFYLLSLLCRDFTHAFPFWVTYILALFSFHSYLVNKII